VSEGERWGGGPTGILKVKGSNPRWLTWGLLHDVPEKARRLHLGLATSPEISHGWGLSYLSPKFQDNCPVVRFYFGVSQGTRYDLSARSLNAPTILSFA
jgi:hypothetical protein